jgi:hypothetical protein
MAMASKLDQMIAEVTMTVPNPDPAPMIAKAAEVAPRLTPEDVGQLPERWCPKITAKAAGAPHLRDPWPRAWFEAIVEILCQKGAAGLPALFELLQRDNATYHEMVALRLLRLAAAGLDREAILAALKARLPELHRTHVYASVRAVVFWSDREAAPLEVLRLLAKLKVKDAEGDTVGTYIEQFEAELADVQARRAPQKADDPLDERIVSVAILGLEPDAFRAKAAEAAQLLGAAAVQNLAERLKKPNLTIMRSRAPAPLTAHEAAWSRAVVEILGHLGAGTIPAAWSVLDDQDVAFQERALRLLCLLAARGSQSDRDAILAPLRKRLPSMHNRELRPVVSDLLMDARTDPRVREVLDALGDVIVKDYGNGTIAIRAIVEALYVPPKPVANPAYKTASRQFAERFGNALVAKDFAAAKDMLCAALRKKHTPEKLATLVAKESRHSGPPDVFTYDDNDTTAAELRDGGGGFPRLPRHVTDANFRRWCCLQFLPGEDSDLACFDWWMAVMEEKGELKVGFFHILDAD